ncbi:MAG TPA: NADH-quinone oxidoreductase subunit A [Fibrobacteria bacterium]|nr:NADH-quinone oxidoreductase subunit A [Fibrobacteria bacterium]
MAEYILIGIFALVGAMFAGGAMVVSRLLAPRFPDKGGKLEAYESGEQPIGSARIRFKVGYYLFALVFLVFDVEAIFLFPALATMRHGAERSSAGIPPLFIFVEVILFVAILGFALFYALRKKALAWD